MFLPLYLSFFLRLSFFSVCPSSLRISCLVSLPFRACLFLREFLSLCIPPLPYCMFPSSICLSFSVTLPSVYPPPPSCVSPLLCLPASPHVSPLIYMSFPLYLSLFVSLLLCFPRVYIPPWVCFLHVHIASICLSFPFGGLFYHCLLHLWLFQAL